MPVARELGLDPLWITCDPDNIPSRRACEKAGAEFEEAVEVPTVEAAPFAGTVNC